jgi:thioredoxin-dependent peroxiredoxin
LLCDVDRAVGRAYGVERGADEPYPDYPKRITYLIDPSGNIAKVYVVSDVGAHPDEVLEDIQRLGTAA